MTITCVNVESWNESMFEHTLNTISIQFAFNIVLSYLCRAIKRGDRIVQRKCE